MSGYSFPILKSTEIVTCMADLQIPLSLDDLERPTPQKMIAVFEGFTDILMGLGREHFAQPPNFAVMELLEHPDLHQESITLMSFYRQLCKLVVEVGVGDFCIRDLIKPEPGRVRRILSAIINFAKFREERLAVFEQCTTKSAEYVEKRQVLDDKNRELAEYVNTLRLKRAEEEPELQRFREKNQVLTTELRELKRVQTAMTNDIDALKKTKTDDSEKLAASQFLLANLKQDCVRVRSRIVQSPEKLQQAIADMSASIVTEKANLASIEKRIRDLHSKIEMLDLVDHDIVLCSKLLEECEAELKKATVSLQKVNSEKENIEKKESELREHKIKEQHLRRQLTNMEDKIARLQAHQQSKREASSDKLEFLKVDYEKALKERDHNQAKMDLNNSRILELEVRMTDLRKKMEIESNSLREDFLKLRMRTEQFKANLTKAIRPKN